MPHGPGMKRVKPIPKRQRPRLFLKEWRKHRHLTQAQLAERAGISQGMISHLENNKSDFTGEMLESLASALSCTASDLMTRNPLDPEAPWSIWDTLEVPERRQAVEILKALKRAANE